MSYDEVLKEMKIISEKTIKLADSIDQPMSKKEAAEYMGVTERVLERYMTRTRHPLPYRNWTNGVMYLLRSDIVNWIKLR